jgi:hypothetical protein
MRHLLGIFVLLVIPAAALAQPAEVRRVLRTFDFEERAKGNDEDLPMHWSKVDGAGFPHYVNGRLATDTARSGKYSFRLDLDGGSLAYRYEPGLIKVRPGGHYHIEGFCKTTLLPHARARMTAYFVDLDGRLVPGSVRHSELYSGHGIDDDWGPLSIEMSPEAPKAEGPRNVKPLAASLVIEVELLQPAQFAEPALGKRTLHSQDIRGTAWFDDISISQVPRVSLVTDRPGNVFRKGDRLRLNVHVDDPFTDDLAAQLVVRDANGKLVYQRSGALDLTTATEVGPARIRLSLDLPDLPAGWYEAALVMSSGAKFLGSQSLTLVQLADEGAPTRPDGRFGFIATDLPFAGWDALPDILPLLSGGRVKLSLWSASGDIQEMDAAAFDSLLERLQELGITPTACLLDLPPALGRALDAEAISRSPDPEHPIIETGWARVLQADPKLWEPQLSYLISRHANHLDRWQLGADGSDAFVTDPKMRQAYGRVYREFARLVEKPDLAMPWPAWYEPDGDLPSTVALSIPPQIVLPRQLPLYVQDLTAAPAETRNPTTAPTTAPTVSPAGLPARPRNLSLSLQWLDRDRYGREAQIRDAAQRVIYALSADARRIDLPLPFTVRTEADGSIVQEPQELLPVLRTLITTLGGATFKGKMPVADGVEAFLFDRDGQGILALWDKAASSPGAAPRELALNLGERPASIDLWGNVRPLLKRAGADKPGFEGAGQVRLKLGALPLLLVNIDGQLAQLRSSVVLDRPLIESSFEPHSRRLRFVNTYRTPISGDVRLRPPEGWTINPPSLSFSLNPGEAFDHELEIVIPYNSVAGAKTIAAEFSMPGEATPHFSVPVAASLGLSDVGMQTLALRDGDDVVIQQMITNYGDKPINYGAFAIFPGQARQERLVTNLGPGHTAIKRYRFTGVKTGPLKARVGVKELAGTRILNDEVPVQ